VAQRNRVVPDQNFLHQQPQNLLSHRDIQRLGSNPQLTAKACQALCQLQIFCFVRRRHLQRL
jgi:hypothetical protein